MVPVYWSVNGNNMLIFFMVRTSVLVWQRQQYADLWMVPVLWFQYTGLWMVPVLWYQYTGFGSSPVGYQVAGSR